VVTHSVYFEKIKYWVGVYKKNIMVVQYINDHPFWGSQENMLKSTKNQKIFIKHGAFSFSSFDNYDFFLKWFLEYKEKCSSKKSPFEIYELMRTGIDMCFAADVEVYVKPNLALGKRNKLVKFIMDDFYRIYNKYGQSDNLIFMEDHRLSSTKMEKKGPEVPMYKISFHVLGKSEIFNEMNTTCKMKTLASHIDKELTKSIQTMFSWPIKFSEDKHGKHTLDMKIYTRNRPMRTIMSQKETSSGDLREGFKLCERSKHVHFSECFITQNLSENGKEYFDYDFPVIDDVVQPNVLKRKHCNFRVIESSDRNIQNIKTEDRIRRYLFEKHGDNVNVKFNGRSYEVRGYRKECPVCKDSHINNGAYINDLGGNYFEYNCQATDEKNIRFKIEEPNKQLDLKYLESFEYIESKVISISAPMGSGKTYQIEKFIEKNYKDKNILFITCRRGMARSLKGRLQFYELYTDKINQPRQLHQYESLHKVDRNFYDLVVIDEIRSTLNAAVCMETNRHNITTNMETLQEVCSYAEQVICADADLSIDGTVSEFYKNTFESSDIHHIEHTTGVVELHHKFAGEMKFIDMIQKDLKDGKKIMLCCGSATKLKTIGKLAEDIVTKSKVGIYYADCPKQEEIENVEYHWDNYQFIGFTSTITVSVDYQKPVDTVYIYPDLRTCSPREMNQMRARARNITSRTVVVKYDGLEKNGKLVPLDFHLQSAKNMEMNKIISRRQLVASYGTESEKTLYGTVFKKGFGYNAKYYSTVLTDLWAWSRVEQLIKNKYWIQFFISIVSQKGHTYSRKPEYCDNELFIEKVEQVKDMENTLSDEKKELMNTVSIESMDEDTYRSLINAKIRGEASIEDIVKIDKYKVQRLYSNPVDADFIKIFKKKKRAIFNRSFLDAFPGVNLRKEIDLHRLRMQASIDDFRLDAMQTFELRKTLSELGFGEVGDTRIRIDLNSLSLDKMDKVTKCVQFINKCDMGRSSTECPITRFRFHVNNVLGYGFKRHKVTLKGKSWYVFSLVDDIGEIFLDNNIFPDRWIDNHKYKVEKFVVEKKEDLRLVHVNEFIKTRDLKRKIDDNIDSVLHSSKKYKSINSGDNNIPR